MANGSLIIFISISLVIIAAALYVGIASIKSKKSELKWIAMSACFGIFSVVFYFGRIFAETRRSYMTLSSLCFIGILMSMYFFMRFVNVYTHMAELRWNRLLLRAILVAVILDLVVWIVNPFCGWAWGCEPSMGVMNFHVAYRTSLYYFHHLLGRLMFFFSMGLLFYRYLYAPKVFRKRYQGIIVFVAFFIMLNFLLDKFVDLSFEYSIHFYCWLPICAYLSCRYAVMDILNYFKDNVFENIEQGIVLFDFKGALIFHNTKAEKLLAGIKFRETLRQEAFLKTLKINPVDSADASSTQFYVAQGGIAMCCDFRQIKENDKRPIGNLFVFSDTLMKTDLVTGFRSWESFKVFIEKESTELTYPMTVVLCDLNNLSSLNSAKGRNFGDGLLRDLASALKKYFPQDSYFVRGEDAKLVVLCAQMELSKIEKIMKQIKPLVNSKFLYAVDELSSPDSNIVDVISSARQTLNQKKLMDKGSAHSELLTSLERALQECDSDTEAHVRRTQRMGAALGKRIGLTDKQQSSLSLLCLLHDIGKIGVPLDILNKPGKLTDEEWNYIKTHVHKGYQIAKSSKGLNEISDMILHHHERWDGKGYPDGLKQEEIPLLSRIISVVDAFDAMVSNRSYRAAKSVDEAVAELERCSGTQFDPMLVKEFVPICRNMVGNVIPDEEKVRMPADVVAEKSRAMKSKFNGTEHNVHAVVYSHYVLNSRNEIIKIDDNFEMLTGYSWDDIKERTMEQQDLIPEEDVTEYLCFVSEALAKKPIAYCEHRLKRKDGKIINVICVGKVIYDSASHETRSEIIVSNSPESSAKPKLRNKAV
jgi:PAS domain S-box-containing protein